MRALRQRMTGRLRQRLVERVTALPDERRARAQRVLRTGPVADWYGRAPVIVRGGMADGLYVSTAGLPLDHAQAGLIVRGTLEPPVQEALRRTIPPGGVVLDVGANIGFFSLLAARLAGPGGRVIAFEPVPWCAEAVRENARLNGLDGAIEVREAAVAASSGRMELLVVGEASWSHLSVTGRHADTRDEIDVEAVALDDLDIPPPDVVKIDVEGAELAVIEGMRETLRRHRPVLVVELHATNEPLAALLDDVGYRAENLDSARPITEDGPGIHVIARAR